MGFDVTSLEMLPSDDPEGVGECALTCAVTCKFSCIATGSL
jgi:hypothetical protein